MSRDVVGCSHDPCGAARWRLPVAVKPNFSTSSRTAAWAKMRASLLADMIFGDGQGLS